MRIKTDENIGKDAIGFLRDHGHDVMSVREQNLGGQPDDVIFEVCCRERRTLITLDHDFGQVPRFPPDRSSGIVIIESGAAFSLPALTEKLRNFLDVARQHPVEGKLWIVEPGRIRIHLGKDE